MWINFGGKLIQTGEYTEFEIKHKIDWDDIIFRSSINYGKDIVILEARFINPSIKLIKTMLNPVLDKIDTKYDNKIHKDISESRSNYSNSTFLSSSSYSSSSRSVNTVVECKGKTDEYNYREHYEIVELKFPKETINTYMGDVFSMEVHISTDELSRALSKNIGIPYTRSHLHRWLMENSNSFVTDLDDQDRTATESGMYIISKIYQELNIEEVLRDFIENEKSKATSNLINKLNGII